MLGCEALLVDRSHIFRQCILAAEGSGWFGVLRVVCSGDDIWCMLVDVFIDDFNGNGAIGAGLDTGWCFAFFEAAVAHITLTYYSKVCVIFGNVVWAL